MRALVLERKRVLSLRDIELPSALGPDDVRIRLHTVGVCGSDVHYYTHGGIGSYIVKSPMVLGHEASGTITEAGANVRSLHVGDRVCMEPGVPNFRSKATRLGVYNVDPDVTFWATPPVHGCLTGSVVHPAAFTFKLADNVTYEEGAMVEPFAVGMQAATRARIKPGDVAVVLGAGPIGIMVALAALAGGCSKVLMSDVHQPKLDIAGPLPGDHSGQHHQARSCRGREGGDRRLGRRYRVRRERRREGDRGRGQPCLSGGRDRSGRHSGRSRRVQYSRRDQQGIEDRDGLPLRQYVREGAQPHRLGQGRPQAAHLLDLRFRALDRGLRARRRRASRRRQAADRHDKTPPPEPMAELSFRKISKKYGETEVVSGFNLEVHNHEFIVFLGPSGCGKSTILRMIAGLEEITGGELSIDGRVVNELPPRERNIAMVFQSYALYPHMSVRENITFGLRRMKIGASEIERRVEAAAVTLGLEPFLDRKSTALSGGQQQRVAIARAIVKTPGVFLFDEPLSNLDAKLRNHMRVEIARLHQRLKTTTVYVTHDQLEAMTLADRIVLLRNGLIEQVGSPREIFDRPNSQFVAAFIGTPAMNFFDVDVNGSKANGAGRNASPLFIDRAALRP